MKEERITSSENKDIINSFLIEGVAGLRCYLLVLVVDQNHLGLFVFLFEQENINNEVERGRGREDEGEVGIHNSINQQ